LLRRQPKTRHLEKFSADSSDNLLNASVCFGHVILDSKNIPSYAFTGDARLESKIVYQARQFAEEKGNVAPQKCSAASR
jgi:hypothetical protein